MLDVLDSVAGPDYVPAILWTFGALVLLLIVLLIVKLIRGMTFGTFVAGGRNRKTRLAVMDATAVDSHRRLVLVRRDDIEHLLLIGGPTDVVVERDIRLVASRRPALTGEAAQQQMVRPRPSQPASAPTPAPATRPAPQPVSTTPAGRPGEAASSPRPAPQRYSPATTFSSTPAYPSGNSNSRSSPQPRQESVDDALMKELEVSFDEPAPATPASKSTSASLDDEMAKLLGELSSHKR